MALSRLGLALQFGGVACNVAAAAIFIARPMFKHFTHIGQGLFIGGTTTLLMWNNFLSTSNRQMKEYKALMDKIKVDLKTVRTSKQIGDKDPLTFARERANYYIEKQLKIEKSQ